MPSQLSGGPAVVQTEVWVSQHVPQACHPQTELTDSVFLPRCPAPTPGIDTQPCFSSPGFGVPPVRAPCSKHTSS